MTKGLPAPASPCVGLCRLDEGGGYCLGLYFGRGRVAGGFQRAQDGRGDAQIGKWHD
ncbi:hypothetical protein C3F00_037960, partial [Pseudomonas sp. MWU13-2860]